MDNRVFEIHVEDIYEESLKSCIGFTKIRLDTVRGEKLLKKCKEVQELYCKDYTVKIIILPFPSNNVQHKSFLIKDRVIQCEELALLNKSNIVGGYLYSVFIDNYNYENMTTLQMFYYDSWLSAYVEASWKSLKDLLVMQAYNDFSNVKDRENLEVSKSFSPGFDSINIKSMKDIFELMNLKKYGMRLNDNMIVPSKSITGIYLINYK